jgi:hypothetical protein
MGMKCITGTSTIGMYPCSTEVYQRTSYFKHRSWVKKVKNFCFNFVNWPM